MRQPRLSEARIKEEDNNKVNLSGVKVHVTFTRYICIIFNMLIIIMHQLYIRARQLKKKEKTANLIIKYLPQKPRSSQFTTLLSRTTKKCKSKCVCCVCVCVRVVCVICVCAGNEQRPPNANAMNLRDSKNLPVKYIWSCVVM